MLRFRGGEEMRHSMGSRFRSKTQAMAVISSGEEGAHPGPWSLQPRTRGWRGQGFGVRIISGQWFLPQVLKPRAGMGRQK